MTEIPPLIITENGKSSGFLFDVAHELAKELNVNNPGLIMDEPKVLPWNRAYRDITNEPGKLMLQMSRTEEREPLFNWIAPVTEIEIAFVTLKEPRINSLEEARDVGLIGVYGNSRLEAFLREKGFSSNLFPTSDSEQSAKLLDRNRIQAWYAITDEARWEKSKGFIFRPLIIGEPIVKFTLWLISSATLSTEVSDEVKRTYQSMQQDGTVDRIRNQYFSTN
ncbi:MAG: transporter substrate-binding domain-containing protein [Rhodospirillales bacterium]|nr:transporter substrate-binding domain-containing protein [Rhodospirillales bacterium]